MYMYFMSFSMGGGKGKKTFMQNDQPTFNNVLKYKTDLLKRKKNSFY